MTESGPADVPSGENLQSPAGARAWADAADRKRPHRVVIRAMIADALRRLPAGARVLELGSGPGYLAEQVLRACSQLGGYTLLDFSEPMLDMSRRRLASYPAASFVCADFKSDGWTDLVEGPYDAIVSMQAVHEVRHKRHVPALYRQIYRLLKPGGPVLICDRVPEDDTPRSTALFMTAEEQVEALLDAGVGDVRLMTTGDALALCEGRRR